MAVGVVFDARGRVLLAQRPEGKPYAGWWEFPGGKLEAGESVHEALVRELHEELGLEVVRSRAWIVREFIYPHAHVRLFFRQVRDFRGEPSSRENQAFAWCDPRAVTLNPLLPATVPVLQWLALPESLEEGDPCLDARPECRTLDELVAAADRGDPWAVLDGATLTSESRLPWADGFPLPVYVRSAVDLPLVCGRIVARGSRGTR